MFNMDGFVFIPKLVKPSLTVRQGTLIARLLPTSRVPTSTGVAKDTAVAGVTGTKGSKLAARKSFRTLSASNGEFDGRLIAKLGGESLSGAGRLLALPLGFMIPALEVGDLGLLEEAWDHENGTSTK